MTSNTVRDILESILTLGYMFIHQPLPPLKRLLANNKWWVDLIRCACTQKCAFGNICSLMCHTNAVDCFLVAYYVVQKFEFSSIGVGTEHSSIPHKNLLIYYQNLRLETYNILAEMYVSKSNGLKRKQQVFRGISRLCDIAYS